MMGTVVLSMLLGWFGAVAVLTLFSRGGEDVLAEEPVSRTTGAPRLAPEE